MKASTNPSPKGKSAAQQIDAIIRETEGWRGKKLSQLRALIKQADPAVVEDFSKKFFGARRSTATVTLRY